MDSITTSWPGFSYIGIFVVCGLAIVISGTILFFIFKGIGSFCFEIILPWIEEMLITKERLVEKVKKLYQTVDKISVRKSLRLLSKILYFLKEIREPAIYLDNDAAPGYDIRVNYEIFPEKWDECYDYLAKIKLSPKRYRDFDLARIKEITQRVYTLLTE